MCLLSVYCLVHMSHVWTPFSSANMRSLLLYGLLFAQARAELCFKLHLEIHYSRGSGVITVGDSDVQGSRIYCRDEESSTFGTTHIGYIAETSLCSKCQEI